MSCTRISSQAPQSPVMGKNLRLSLPSREKLKEMHERRCTGDESMCECVRTILNECVCVSAAPLIWQARGLFGIICSIFNCREICNTPTRGLLVRVGASWSEYRRGLLVREGDYWSEMVPTSLRRGLLAIEGATWSEKGPNGQRKGPTGQRRASLSEKGLLLREDATSDPLPQDMTYLN